MGLLSGLVRSLTAREARADPPASSPATTREGGPSGPERVAAARQRVEAQPDDARAWHRLGAALMHRGRRREALRAFREAHRRDDASPDIALALGVAAWEAGETAEAERVLDVASTRAASPPELSLARARMLVSSGRIADARALAERAQAHDASRGAALAILARCERRDGHEDRAEALWREAIAEDDGDPARWEALAQLLSSQGRTDDAGVALDRAVVAAATRGIPLDEAFLRAELARQRGAFGAAATLLDGALRAAPHPAGYFMLAEALLVQGRYATGWHYYEFRRFEAASLAERRTYAAPEWTGQALDGRTVLVEAEQGIGDIVWFARYLPLLKERGARVVLLPRADMQALSRRLPGVDHVLADGEPLPRLDYHVKLMSLALRFGTTLATIPGGVPYLAADPACARRWAERLPPGGAPRVGLVWAGKREQPRDRFRSLDLARLMPILRVPGVRFHSLQKGYAEAQLATLPPDVRVEPLGAGFDDLDDLVGAIDRMDLVLSVCTGPAHVAGAMGKPVWTMIAEPADLRWLTGRDDSPWYPTMRLFRQPSSGDWDAVIARVAQELSRGPAAWSPQAMPAAASTQTAEVASDAPADATASVVEANGAIFMVGSAGAARAVERDPSWRPDLLALAAALSREGDAVLEAGAGIGAHALPLARALGGRGDFFAAERDARTRRMLAHNVAANRVAAITVLGDASGGPADAAVETVDALALERLDGLKLNDADDAPAILEGSEATLWRCRPWLLVALDDASSAVERVRAFGYRTWAVEAPPRGERFLLALPEEADVREPPRGCVELR
ncbi:MAG TPA: tetratricopeptide repeat protein [Casimicrobiaceae bacterium]|nr:tetratricopeptide repeat protein [Casimicrobiaceae bacterium]